MNDIPQLLQKWNLDMGYIRRQMYRAPTPRERERWHALLLAAQGWNGAHIAEVLSRNPHTIGDWLALFRQRGPASLSFEQSGGSSPSSTLRNRTVEGLCLLEVCYILT